MKWCYLIAGLFWGGALQAQDTLLRQANIRCLTVDDGLSSSMVYSISQDPDGYLWAATANGFNRHDGYDFETFFYDPSDPHSIGGSKAYTNLVDSAGRLWAGGIVLSRFNDRLQKFENFDVNNNVFINTIYQDPMNRIWIGGNGFGLRQIDAETGRLLHIYRYHNGQENSLPNDYINTITGDGKNGLWIGTLQGVVHFDPAKETFQQFLPSLIDPDIRDNQIRDLVLDAEQRLWVALPDGLLRYDLSSNHWNAHHKSSAANGLPTNNITSVFEDRNGQIWVGTDKKGLLAYDEASNGFTHFSAGFDQQRIPPGAINHIFQDDSGALWLSVHNYGMCRFSSDDRKFNLFQQNSRRPSRGLSFNNLLDLHEDKQGIIWIATDGGGLDRFDPKTGTFEHFRHDPQNENSLSSDSVLSIAEDANGILWIGTWAGGLNRFDPKDGSFKHYRAQPQKKNALLSDNIFHTWIDPLGNLWLSVWNKGLQRLDPTTEKFQNYTLDNPKAKFKTTNTHINFIQQDRYGNLWVGGQEGLEKVNAGDLAVEYIQLNRQNDVIDMYHSKEGIYWFATSDGLLGYDDDDGSILSYGKADGFADNFITGIEAQEDGQLWLGSRRGLTLFDPKTKKVTNFNPNYGLQGWEFNRYSHLKTRDGVFYFGGVNGLNQFNPSKVPKNNHVLPVYIDGLELFHKPVPIDENSYLNVSVKYLDYLELPYSQNDITFKFTGIDFAMPHDNRFRFILKGFDADWTEIGSFHRQARYTNLPPGEYTFQVIASNNDGTWNTEGDAITLVIVPPLWMTWPARLLITVTLILIVYLTFYGWNRRAQRKEIKLQTLVEEKTLELEDARKILERSNMQLQDMVADRTSELEKEIIVRRDAETRLKRMAYFDTLTELPNRAWLMNRLQELLREQQHDRFFALLFMDGDQFKMINDSMGHLVGDELLVKVARRLNQMLPTNVRLTRQSGDEFIVLIENVDDLNRPEQVAVSVLESLRQPFYLGQKKIFFNVSIGAVIDSREYSNAEEMLRDADIAMYAAKHKGKACFQVFDQTMSERVQAEIKLVSDLRNAIENEQFFLAYQPIVSLKTGQLHGLEALIRWKHPELGMVPPDHFIQLAERNGMIEEIGLWVLRTACRQVVNWLKQYGEQPGLRIAINLSMRQLLQRELPDQVMAIMNDTGLDGRHIKFEITETALMENAEATIDILDQMNARGLELAIDDFGTGYSSLSYMHRFPVQYLKIDRSFISKIVHDEEARIITRAIISLARSLGQITVAEGIENEKQSKLLQAWGCDLGQGFLIEMPLASDEVCKWFDRTTLVS